MAFFEGLLALADLKIGNIVELDGELAIQARPRGVSARCPGCGTLSQQMHSYSARRLAEWPIGDRPTRICLRARHCRCLNHQGTRANSAESFPGFLRRYSRRSLRLGAALEAEAFALGGQAGSYLAYSLQTPRRDDTLRRPIRRPVTPAYDPPA